MMPMKTEVRKVIRTISQEMKGAKGVIRERRKARA